MALRPLLVIAGSAGLVIAWIEAFLAALPVSALATLGTHFAAIEDELDFVESQLVRVPRQKQLARYSLLVMLGEQGYASAVKV